MFFFGVEDGESIIAIGITQRINVRSIDVKAVGVGSAR